MNGRCVVFQPFDKGVFDKRYDELIEPAITDGEVDSYRVDRDDGAAIPIDTLHEEIRNATMCLADITTRNPSVMYEVGYAIALGKDVILICARSAEKFPFDIQHRGIIQYDSDSPGDFLTLRTSITNRVKFLLKKQETTKEIAVVSPVKSTHGLQPHEFAALALIVGNIVGDTGLSDYMIKSEMEKAGYTKAATQVALIRLNRLSFVEPYEAHDHDNGDTYVAYKLLSAGEDWLLENTDKLEMRLPTPAPRRRAPPPPVFDESIGDDDVPF